MRYLDFHNRHKYEIFGYRGAKKISKMICIELFVKLPLLPKVREQGDKGKPIVISDPKNAISHQFMSIARKLTIAIARNTHEINEKREKQVHIDLSLDMA